MARFLMRVRQFSSATNSHKKPRYDCAVVASAGILGVPKLDLRCFRLSPANFNLSCSPRTAILCPKMNVTPNLLIGWPSVHRSLHFCSIPKRQMTETWPVQVSTVRRFERVAHQGKNLSWILLTAKKKSKPIRTRTRNQEESSAEFVVSAFLMNLETRILPMENTILLKVISKQYLAQ